MALRDIFKFREVPESETSKPFLEHLEDLRWTVVKMAITLVLAMLVCFAFRSLLVRVMQAPLHDVDPQVGALKALGITDSIVISLHLAFYAGIVVSFPLLLYFLAAFVHGAHASLRGCSDFCARGHYCAHARSSDLGRDGVADVFALRKLHLGRLVDGTS